MEDSQDSKNGGNVPSVRKGKTRCSSLGIIPYLKEENAQLGQLSGACDLDTGTCLDVSLLWRAVCGGSEENGLALFEEMHTAVCRADGRGAGVLCLQLAFQSQKNNNGMGRWECFYIVLETFL